MIFDMQGLFSNKQSASIDDLSENTIDLKKGDIVTTPYIADTPRDLGKGNPLPIRIQLVEDAAGAVTVEILSGDALSGEDIDTPTTIGTVVLDGITAGSYNDFMFMPHSAGYGRYLQLQYKVACVATAGFVHGHDQASV